MNYNGLQRAYRGSISMTSAYQTFHDLLMGLETIPVAIGAWFLGEDKKFEVRR